MSAADTEYVLTRQRCALWPCRAVWQLAAAQFKDGRNG